MKLDLYLLAIFASLALALVFPAQGAAASALSIATSLAVALLFFLYGARLSPREAWEGARNLRLHALVLAFTYVLFPILGLLLAPLLRPLLGEDLALGMLFLCAVPSTVQSSIAFTSIARGNVAAALCAASASNILGVILTPLLIALLLHREGAALSASSIQKLALQLLLPFALGQLLRPRIGGFVTRHKRVLGFVDRGSILLVVYAAFSAGVGAGILQDLSTLTVALLTLATTLLLFAVLALSVAVSRWCGFTTADEITIVFCGSKKSLVSGLPMATVLFPAAVVSTAVLPLMIYHQVQLIVCAWLAQRYANRSDVEPAQRVGATSSS